MALAKQIDRFLSLFGLGQTDAPDAFDLRLERSRQRESRRIAAHPLFRTRSKRLAAAIR